MSTVDSFKSLVGIEPEGGKSWQQEFDEACSLTREQRFYGFGGCFIGGWVISLFALTQIPNIPTEPQNFALLYSIGNIIALASTCFLFGPCSQIKKMFDPVRIWATLIYLAAIGLTLFCAFKVQQALPVIACMIVQLLAMIWYCASFIPYGRQCIKNCVGGMCKV